VQKVLVRREPPTTFRGALQLLGRYERPWVDRLDTLLGGAILAAGVGLIAPPLAPLAPLWGWVDQKSEAAGLLRSGLDRIQSKISKLQGYERMELIAAAHTTIVLPACFDVRRKALGPSASRAIGLTEAEHEMLVAKRWRDRDDDLITMLYQAEAPMPTGARGFRENSRLIDDWAVGLFNQIGHFLAGVEAWTATTEYDSLSCAGQALDRYETYFLGSPPPSPTSGSGLSSMSTPPPAPPCSPTCGRSWTAKPPHCCGWRRCWRRRPAPRVRIGGGMPYGGPTVCCSSSRSCDGRTPPAMDPAIT
jgi:hypothetical protein